MRRRRHAALWTALAALLAGPSTHAQPLPFTAFVQLLGALEIGPIAVSTGVSVGPGRALQVAASVFSSQTTRTLTDPTATASTIQLRNGAGSFAPTTGGGFGGPMPLHGFVRYKLNTALVTKASVTLPLQVIGSVPGTTSATVHTKASGGVMTVKLRSLGTGWRTGLFTVNGFQTTPNGATSPLTLNGSGFDNRTPNGIGVVQLVTPFRLELVENGNTVMRQPGLGVFRIEFVPEPGVAWLALGAAGALAALGLGARARPAASAGR